MQVYRSAVIQLEMNQATCAGMAHHRPKSARDPALGGSANKKRSNLRPSKEGIKAVSIHGT